MRLTTRSAHSTLGWVHSSFGSVPESGRSVSWAWRWSESGQYFQAHGALLATWNLLSGLHLGFHAVAGATYVHALLVFPNGRLAPRWSVWFIAVGYLVMAIAFVMIAVTLGTGDTFDIDTESPSDNYSLVLTVDAVFFVLVFALVVPLVGAASQVYRYRAIYAAQERLQTKLVVWVMGLSFVAGLLFLAIAVGVNASTWAGSPGEAFEELEELVLVNFPLLFTIVPASLVVAVLRYGLWDIDLLVNRTLVYGVLTATLVGAYFASVTSLQIAFGGITDAGGDAAIVVSTLVIAALFQPLRRRVQDLIDRRFYRRKYDAARTLAAFSATARDEVDLEALSEELVSVVEETMQPTHALLWLRRPERDGNGSGRMSS